MIERVCEHIHNYFAPVDERRAGTYTIENGQLTLDFVAEGQYFRIVGSTFNDGVYQYPGEDLVDETFNGEIWPMKPPRSFLTVVGEIEAWQSKYGDKADSPFASENVIGVFSYAKASSGSGSLSAWQAAFASRLNPWRRLYD